MVLIIIGGGALGGLSEIYEVCVSSLRSYLQKTVK